MTVGSRISICLVEKFKSRLHDSRQWYLIETLYFKMKGAETSVMLSIKTSSKIVDYDIP